MSRTLILAAALALSPLAACSQDGSPDEPLTPEQVDAAIEEAGEIVDSHGSPEEMAEALANADRLAEIERIEALGLKPYGTDDKWPDDMIDVLLPAPWDSVVDTAGEPVALADLMGPQGAVIVFSRSAEWCPYCQKQMLELDDAIAPLEAEGLKLTVLTYDSPTVISEFQTEKDIGVNLVSDTGSTTIKAWGLLNTGMPEGSRYYGVPHPGFAVLTPEGDIKGIQINEDYKVRPSTDELVQEAVGYKNAG